jgi:hypothetical protein
MKAITRSDFLYLERERIEVRVHGADTWVCPYVGADLRVRPKRPLARTPATAEETFFNII